MQDKMHDRSLHNRPKLGLYHIEESKYEVSAS